MVIQEHLPGHQLSIIQQATAEEAKGELEKAAKLYEAAIKDEKLDEHTLDRLMILYRKLKKYKDELRVINKGIRMFEDFYKRAPKKRKTGGKKLADLSNAFLRTTGLKDKKGKELYQPEPIARWQKRKSVVERKLK